MSIIISELSSRLQAIASFFDQKENGGNEDGVVNTGREMRSYREAVHSKDSSNKSSKTRSSEDSLATVNFVKNKKPETYIPNSSPVVINSVNLDTGSANTVNYSQSSPKHTATTGNYTNVSNAGGFSSKYDDKIIKYANNYGLDPNLVKAVIRAESSFNPNATSSCNCKGLMQVNPKYHSGNLYDVDKNLDTGCQILSSCLETFGGDLNKALMAYNQGVGGAKSSLKKGVTSTGYSRKVLDYYSQLKSG